MRRRIFLSYSNRDRAVAESVDRELKKLGVASFRADRDVKNGTKWSKAIVDAVRNSDLVAVFVSEPGSTASNWIGYEIGSASALGKNVVILKPSSYSVRDMPSDLASWHTMDFDPKAPDVAARSLVSNLNASA